MTGMQFCEKVGVEKISAIYAEIADNRYRASDDEYVLKKLAPAAEMFGVKITVHIIKEFRHAHNLVMWRKNKCNANGKLGQDDMFSESHIQVAYIAGPYRAETPYQIQRNIEAARAVALKYWKLGYAVICPHSNTAFFDGEADDSVWMEGDIEIMRRCDVVVMMKNWMQSEGARTELDEARSAKKPIFYDE